MLNVWEKRSWLAYSCNTSPLKLHKLLFDLFNFEYIFYFSMLIDWTFLHNKLSHEITSQDFDWWWMIMNDQHNSAKIQLNFHEQPPRVSYHLSQNIKISFPRWNLWLIAHGRFKWKREGRFFKKEATFIY